VHLQTWLQQHEFQNWQHSYTSPFLFSSSSGCIGLLFTRDFIESPKNAIWESRTWIVFFPFLLFGADLFVADVSEDVSIWSGKQKQKKLGQFNTTYCTCICHVSCLKNFLRMHLLTSY
jgi:hypothetical protein